MQGIINVRGVKKVFSDGGVQTEVLRGVDLQIQAGEFVSIVGPSGSGKSTLLGLMAGLDTVTSGQIELGGVEITRLGEGRLAKVRGEFVGYVFQSFNLIPNLSALENVELPLILNGRMKGTSQRARELLAQVGLAQRLRHRPSQLSGGEQQRVAIARALACDPPILFADEPTGNLDDHNSEQVIDLLIELSKSTQKTLVVVTHDLEFAKKASRQLTMAEGRVVEEVV